MIQYSRDVRAPPRSRGVLDPPSVHDASATPAMVLWRWDNVMASSALKSALRYTACVQAVYLKIKLPLDSAGRHRRSVGNLSATPGRRRFGPAATNRSGLSQLAERRRRWDCRFKLARQPDLRRGMSCCVEKSSCWKI